MEHYKFSAQKSYARVATACPEVSVANVDQNATSISELYNDAAKQGASLVVFPELCLTGYSIGDLVMNRSLLAAAKEVLGNLATLTNSSATTAVVGLPLEVGNALFNCAAVIADGEIKGIVPKKHLPSYGEFYEKRWYKSWDQPNALVSINGQQVPIGNDLLFDIGGVPVGVEICEDLWSEDPPSRKLAEHGALIIANPSASPELVGKATYRRQLVGQQSARLILGYLYAGADSSESTMDTVMGGHQIIAENGRILAERRPFSENQSLTFADIDLDHLRHDRRRNTNTANRFGMPVIATLFERPIIDPRPNVAMHPFLPSTEDKAKQQERLQTIVDIQAYGLVGRLKAVGTKQIHLGLSGGLDSTHALLVACKTAEIMGLDPDKLIRTYTMPGMASTERTQSNAVKLAAALNVPNEVIPISDLAQRNLGAIGHNTLDQDITYENAQARARTTVLFNKANQLGGIVLGTGDLSEIALGWATYNGDHMSHYNVNAGVPKTLMRALVDYLADTYDEQSKPRRLLKDILNTPVSPELTTSVRGTISQETEAIIGPYELHDFFLYHLIRWGEAPDKIRFLAETAFRQYYQPDEISKWLGVFLKRFTANQFKRSAMPDGPKVGSVALSPRSDWRMPSDLLTFILEY